MTRLVVGGGYLGRRVADAWRAAGHPVAALTRGRSAELAAAGFAPVAGDVTDPTSLRLPPADVVLYAVGMDRSAGKSMRAVYVGGLANVLAALPSPPKSFVYVSSTSVYGQTDGEWVNEESPTEPAEESGRVVLEAEHLLRDRLPTAVVLRFAGIYGPGRVIRRAAVERGEPLAADPDGYLNLIHVEDGVRAVLAAADRAPPGSTYCVSDGRPPTRREFYTHMAELLGAPKPTFTPTAGGEANRRVGNRRMREDLGVELAYPDYRAGLRQAVCTTG